MSMFTSEVLKLNIQKYLSLKIAVDITDLLTTLNCNHKWIKYGHGFKCENCNTYTGYHDSINNAIQCLIDTEFNNKQLTTEEGENV